MAQPLLFYRQVQHPSQRDAKAPQSTAHTRYENPSQTVKIRVQYSIPPARQKPTPQNKFSRYSNRGTCIEASYMPRIITATTTYLLPQKCTQSEFDTLAFPCAFNPTTDTPILPPTYLNNYQLNTQHISLSCRTYICLSYPISPPHTSLSAYIQTHPIQLPPRETTRTTFAISHRIHL